MKNSLVSQLLSSLNMLQDAIHRCPDELWDHQGYENKYWHIVYHTLFFTDLYLSPSDNEFVSWERAKNEYQFLGPVPWPPHYTPIIEESYTKQDLIEYLEKIKEDAPNKIHQDDLNASSGFDWLPFNRTELHIYSIRHIQHHTGQLIERLRNSGVTRNRWVVK
ncbi:DinB family protein [Paenibacillus tarimensis]